MDIPDPQIFSHLDMLLDAVRVSAYASAISEVVRPGDVVIDYGCGLGVFAILAARAGASRVYAIESNEHVAAWAQMLISGNCLSESVILLNSNAWNVELPEFVDVIVAEIMTPCGLNEYDNRPLARIRDRFLKTGGRMIPQEILHAVSLYSDPSHNYQYLKPWEESLYDINWSALFPLIYSRHYESSFDRSCEKTLPVCWWHVNLSTDLLCEGVKRSPTYINIVFAHTCVYQGLVLFFDAILSPNVKLCNGPNNARTLWGSGIFPFKSALYVHAGDFIEVGISYDFVNHVRVYFIEIMHKRGMNSIGNYRYSYA